MPHDLVPHVRASLNAKLQRLLERPLIARIAAGATTLPAASKDDTPPLFRSLSEDEGSRALHASKVCDDEVTLSVTIDYEDAWREREKEVLTMVDGALEMQLVFLTEDQRRLLVHAPREFLALRPGPVRATLSAYRRENFGGRERVVELTVTPAPTGLAHVRYVAIVPQLVSIVRQLAALHEIETAEPGSRFEPLRALVGIAGATASSTVRVVHSADEVDRLDQHQLECLAKVLESPHFSVIHGPPGSGKTSVVAAVVRRALAAGESVLVVSPTHVAVDNVVERIVGAKEGSNLLEMHTLPIRYSARTKKLSRLARAYSVGPARDERSRTVAARVQEQLIASVPIAGALFEQLSPPSSEGVLSSSVARRDSVVCGTTLGVLAYDRVKHAEPFDLVIVDEASKLTLPEFLAIAVKARRWMIVGDPAQLPPFANAEENAVALDDVIPPIVELACTVASFIGRTQAWQRREDRLVVIARDETQAARAIQLQCASTLDKTEPVAVIPYGAGGSALGEAIARLLESSRRLIVFIERGLAVERAAFPLGVHVVEPKLRAQAVLLEKLNALHHAEPWAARVGVRLRATERGECLRGAVPSRALLEGLSDSLDAPTRLLEVDLAARVAVATLSVFEWLTGFPGSDVPILKHAASYSDLRLIVAVRPFVGTLRKQYRMHPSLSRAPRRLFYFDQALLDGIRPKDSNSRLDFHQVESSTASAEANPEEAREIGRLLARLEGRAAAAEERASALVITPYGEQRELLASLVAGLALRRIDASVCTLDSCQGREADWVLLSLVKSRATAFLDNPKRWNVALTRAKERLVIVGDVASYLSEAVAARQKARRSGESPRMSVLAAVIEACDQSRSAIQ